MPIDIDPLMDDLKNDPSLKNGTGSYKPTGAHADAPNKWGDIFTPHPPGGGPFGGQHKALVALVGFMRAKSYPFEGAVDFAIYWNIKYCLEPRLEEDYVRKVVGEQWYKWKEGGIPDAEPGEKDEEEDWDFLTLAQMQAEEKRIGELKWIVDKVIPEGGLVYFSAPSEGGKTWLLSDFVRAVAAGDKWLGRFPAPRIPIGYIDEEMGVKKIMPRLRKLGVPMDSDTFRYTNKVGVRFDTPQGVAKVMKKCEKYGLKILIVDTLTRVHQLDEDNNSHMKRLFKNFSQFLDKGITILVAHHDRKKGAESDVAHERMRGASEIAASADMSFSVDKHGSFFRLSTTKGRLVAEEDKIVLDFVVQDNPEKTATTVRAMEPGEKHERTLTSMEKRILDTLDEASFGLATNDLVEKVGGKKTVVLEAAKRLVEAGKLATRKEGRFTYYEIAG